MYKKLVLVVLLLWLVGTAGMAWGLRSKINEKKALQKKYQIKNSKLEKVENLFENQNTDNAKLDNIQSITEAMINEDWQIELEEQNNPIIIRELILKASAASIAAGIAVLILGGVSCIVTRWITKKIPTTSFEKQDNLKHKKNSPSLWNNILAAKENSFSKGTSNGHKKTPAFYQDKMTPAPEIDLTTSEADTYLNTNPLANSAYDINEILYARTHRRSQK